MSTEPKRVDVQGLVAIVDELHGRLTWFTPYDSDILVKAREALSKFRGSNDEPV